MNREKHKTVAFSPAAQGLFRALAELGSTRHFDDAAIPLVEAGLAKVEGRRLVLRRKGKEIARAFRRRPGRSLH